MSLKIRVNSCVLSPNSWLLIPLFFIINLNARGQTTKGDDFSILFIGNSLTYTNNLPKLVKKYAKSKKINVNTSMFAYPNYSISDHWDNENEYVQTQIASNHYDFVVIQQGPSSQKDGKQMLMEYGKKYKALCNKYNSKLVFFMVWPSMNYYETFDGVINNYTMAAKEINAILCPVGEIWKQHFDTTQNFDYYSADSFHPSVKGSKKASEIIVEYLFNCK